MRPSVLSSPLPPLDHQGAGIPQDKRAGKVSGGDLLEEPCKHMKKEQSRPGWHMPGAEAPES